MKQSTFFLQSESRERHGFLNTFVLGMPLLALVAPNVTLAGSADPGSCALAAAESAKSCEPHEAVVVHLKRKWRSRGLGLARAGVLPEFRLGHRGRSPQVHHPRARDLTRVAVLL